MTNEEIDNLSGRELEIQIAIAKGWCVKEDSEQPGVWDVWHGLSWEMFAGTEELAYTNLPYYLESNEAMKLQVEEDIGTDLFTNLVQSDKVVGSFVLASVIKTDGTPRYFFDIEVRLPSSPTPEQKVEALCTSICRCYLKAHYGKIQNKEAVGVTETKGED